MEQLTSNYWIGIMELFGIGGAEVILIIIIAMVVAGPKRVVQWAYLTGKFLARMRRIWAEMMMVIQKEMHDAGIDVEMPKTPPTRQSISQMTRDMLKPYTQELDEAQKDIQRNLEDVEREANIKQNVLLGEKRKAEFSPPPDVPVPQNGYAPPPKPQTGFGTWSSATNQSPSTSTENDEQQS